MGTPKSRLELHSKRRRRYDLRLIISISSNLDVTLAKNISCCVMNTLLRAFFNKKSWKDAKNQRKYLGIPYQRNGSRGKKSNLLLSMKDMKAKKF